MEPVIAYCLKDRKKMEMKDPVEVEMKGGRRALSGTCVNCGTKMFKIMGKKATE